MGEVCSMLRVIDDRMQDDKERETVVLRRRCSATRNDQTMVPADRSSEDFLADEPVLRDLLYGIPTEHNLFEVVCTINRLLFYYVIIRWINLELWSLASDNPYIMNQ